MAHNCENCKFRAHNDKKPDSMLASSGVGTSTFTRAYFCKRNAELLDDL